MLTTWKFFYAFNSCYVILGMLLSSPHSLMTTPKRIISLVPSQTELLYDLGLNDETVGITKFCVHPKEWFNTKTRVGGTKMIRPEVIHQLRPDLIIANKEENVKDQVEDMAKHYPVWVTDINTLDDALRMIANVGALTGTTKKAQEIATNIQNGFQKLEAQTENRKLRIENCSYLIWRMPYMTIGGDTFINDMLERCGIRNIFADRERYPEITIEQLQTANCPLLLLSSEPYPFKQQHIDELQEQLPSCKIILVDGEMFSWYGSRLLKAPGYFFKLIEEIG